MAARIEARTARALVVALSLSAVGLFVACGEHGGETRLIGNAYVAVAAGEAEPEVGEVQSTTGDEVRLFAVLAATVGGKKVYYTEAPALVLGGRRVPNEQLRRWDGREKVRCLWQTVESPPVLTVSSEEDLRGLRFENFLHPEWGQGWSAVPEFEPRKTAAAARIETDHLAFGTRRFQVWIEFLDPKGGPVALQRFKSAGAENILGQGEVVPGLSSVLPGNLESASAEFGRTGLVPAAGIEMPTAAYALADLGVAFTEPLVLRRTIGHLGLRYEDLPVRRIDLANGPAWEAGLVGGVISAGARWVLLFADDGNGVLDANDLCFDFGRGAMVARLGDVFVGRGEVEMRGLSGSNSKALDKTRNE